MIHVQRVRTLYERVTTTALELLRRQRGIRWLACLAMAVSCGGATPSVPATTGPQSYRTTHFDIVYEAEDRLDIRSIGDTIEANYERIRADLRSTELPVVHVRLFVDHAVFASAVAPAVGMLPAWATGLATAQDQIYAMSPSAEGFGPIGRVESTLVHEFAHCVSLHVNPRIGNNPRWFWESVAIRESGQFVDPRTLPYLRDATLSFADLNSLANTHIYDVGFTIGDFMIRRWGYDTVSQLIRTNADVSALGVNEAGFLQLWYADLHQRYGVP